MRASRFLALLLAMTLILAACSTPTAPSPGSSQPVSSSVPALGPIPEPEPEPVFEWRTDAPENHRMDPEVFADLHAAVEESTTVKNNGAGDGTGSYGYQWWIRPYTAGSYGNYAPQNTPGTYDCYNAFGAWGQFIFVVPELELVCVITSSVPQNSYTPRPYFTDYMLSAYTD